MAALFELSPDAMVGQSLYFLADEPHATLSIARSFGTLAQGGDFEAVYVMIRLYGSDDLAGVELFELENRDAALARFEELRPDPSRATRRRQPGAGDDRSRRARPRTSFAFRW